ncbi:GrdX family protein [Merdimmobilis hominis]|jgi:hypothetical protein|uniref:GrdX protein n=1 Tax=uncultured Anaerotruncus sp. TaxID=905011 RepID=A0A6N2SWF9_9FIRM|nr:GrdX family protein [Merdimmobilis hominis]MCD4836055.1 GrdX family protein [Merdimmobilis hominis]PWL60615.1 MAG: GrdX protein [Oscillospiraceae bacterium]PWL62388.1 MAG: GrdX protein [Oscillospiraceae bacterium]
MKPTFKIVTNNPLVVRELTGQYTVEFVDGTYHDVLVALRDQIHKGHRLYSHPLSGSVKPNETPYKSVLISIKPQSLDMDSVEMIENSIVTCDKFPVKFPHMPDSMREDFQVIDATLLKGALSQILFE